MSAFFFPTFIVNWTQLRCCGDLWNIVHYSFKASSLGNLTPTINSGYQQLSDGSFKMAKKLIPECLDMCNILTIHSFFCKTWHYMDAFQSVFQCSFVFQILIILSGRVLILSKPPSLSGNTNLTEKLVLLRKSSNFWPSVRLCWPKGILGNRIHYLHLFNTAPLLLSMLKCGFFWFLVAVCQIPGQKKILEDLAHNAQQPLIYTTFFIYFDCIQLAKVCGYIAVAKSNFEYLSCQKSTVQTVWYVSVFHMS